MCQARIQYSRDQKNKLVVTHGNHISDYDGIDAGLYAVSEKVFVVLEHLIHGVSTLSLAESLALGYHSVKCMQINDSPWLCVETEALMLHASETNCLAAITPFNDAEDNDDDSTVSITSFSRAAPPSPASTRRKSLLLSVPALPYASSTDHPQMQKREITRRSKSLVTASFESEAFEGIVVPVKESPLEQHLPLISIKNIRDCTLPSHVRLSKSQPDEYTLAIPVETTTTTAITNSSTALGHRSPAKNAYLIQQEHNNSMLSTQEQDLETKSVGHSLRRRSTFMLAIPKETSDADIMTAADENATANRTFEPIALLRRVSKLPSDVTNVTLEASAVNGTIAMQLTVTKQVPWVGYVLLIVALLSVSSQGAAMQVLVGVHPFLKLFWRMSGSAILFGVLAILTTITTTTTTMTATTMPQRQPSVISSSRFFFSRWHSIVWNAASVVPLREGLLCTLAYIIFNSTFIWALDHTSVGHAYIFSNCHSLLLVLGKTTVLGQIVRPIEAGGALLGMIGAAVTTMDHGNAANEDLDQAMMIQQPMVTAIRVIEPSTMGDVVALAGAIGGVFYLTYAKIVRDRMGVTVFLALLFLMTSITLLPLMTLLHVPFITFSFDPNRGLFGWVSHLGVEIICVGVCSGMGTLGFVSAMKYFPPIVISVTMLLEPVIATVISVASGTASFPGVYTYIGGFAVILGTCLVISSSRSSETTVNVTETITSCHGNGTPSKMKGYGSM
jgi:drug/metabolite transporter (DMT)-like permease